MTDQFVFRLDQAEANLIGRALGKLPYDEVYMLIPKLQRQAQLEQTPPTPKYAPGEIDNLPTPDTIPAWEAVMDGSQQEKTNGGNSREQEGRAGNGWEEAGQATDQEIPGHRHEGEGQGILESRRANGEG